ncbi:protein cramped [Eurosta solidaginis]|uniref:protein cramped n=1 Tax=Eurosta solidaginis TaxID=178769 RepID=UPI003530B097
MSANGLGGSENPSAQSSTTTTVPTPVHGNNEETIKTMDSLEKNETQIWFKERGDALVPINSSKSGIGGGKNASERKTGGGGAIINADEKQRNELNSEVTELLGSVKTHNCPGTRASARVIQKMKQDQTRPLTPPPTERDQLKRDEKTIQKTPSQLRSNTKPTWTNLERNHFFDALNEFGKDFEAIGNYINTKLKRRSAADGAFKTKDQVRQHYYQTYHKICKYIKFSDEVRKPAQELYALINYGEMRRKLQFVTDKHFMKLRNLVYQGHITVRCKGKNLRIKTPSCKTLRRLNQLDDSLEDIRLPSKIEVIVSPATMEAFGRVQMVAQNPRVRTTVPLHKKLVNFIKTFQLKWRSAEQKLAEEELKLFPPNSAVTTTTTSAECNGSLLTTEASDKSPAYQDPEMCFLPTPGVLIHRPLLSITEYLGSGNICLAAYEERMGIQVRGETLMLERSANKRPRTDSCSEKRSPESKKNKQLSSPPYEKSEADSLPGDVVKEEVGRVSEHDVTPAKCESSSDELSDELHELLTADTDDSGVNKESTGQLQDEIKPTLIASDSSSATNGNTISSNHNQITAGNQARLRKHANTRSTGRNSAPNFKPLISEAVIRRIRKGWTISTAADITIGDLYVVLGHDSRLELDYYWTDRQQQQANVNAAGVSNTLSVAISGGSAHALKSMTPSDTKLFMQKQNGMPYNPTECNDPDLLKTLSSAGFGNKLKHLLLIANLSERLRKRQCSCGHTCDRNVNKTRLERNLATKTYISTKSYSANSPNECNNVFRQPVAPIRRPIFSMDSAKQLSGMSRQKQSMRQVLVQRMLLPGGSTTNQSYDVLSVKNFDHARKVPGNLGNMSQNSNFESQVPHHDNSLGTATTTQTIPNCQTFINTSTQSDAITNDYDTTDALQSVAQSIEMRDDNHPSTSTTYQMMETVNADVERMYDSIADISLSSPFPDSAFDECTNTSSFNGMTPTHLLRDSSSNSRWLEENLNDFSLTSLLGHLDEINASRDILDPSSNLSVLSESSVDYMHKFQEITALMQSQDKE